MRTGRGALPDVGLSVRAATGGASTITAADARAKRPAVSATVTVTVNVPAAGYRWPAVGADWGPTSVPSPKSNVYVAIPVASVSVELDASAVTANGITPAAGVTLNDAAGAASTTTVAEAPDTNPALSATTTVTK